MIRNGIALCLLTLLLNACSSQPERVTAERGSKELVAAEVGKNLSGNSRQRMEEAIARRILADISKELPTLPLAAQPTYLRDKKTLFESSVDLQSTSERVRMEKQLLDYLYEQTDLRVYSSGYLPKLQEKTSLTWSLDEFTARVKQELSRIDQTIAVLAASSPEQFELEAYMAQRREVADYQQDSFEGRQRYLDNLADAMLDAQLNWYDTLENYRESELAIYGEENMEQMFRFSSEGLTINLATVDNLPSFELRPLAVYYGFPGLRSLDTSATESLKQFLKLPAYQHGWAAYIVEAIGTRDMEYTIDYLLFSRALAAMALADLNINTGVWTVEQAEANLYNVLPYSQQRLRLMLQTTLIDPGQYVATLAGKLSFIALQERCLAEGRGDACHSVFNQRVVDWGPLPFEMLETRLFK